MNIKDWLEKNLPFVEKPARYIGGEINSVIKNHNGRTGIALIYPDAYEVGISNISLKILYHLLNKNDEFYCESAYSPWTDMEALLRRDKMPLFSLETKTPLSDFDLLGFTFQYELLYTNFINILDLSGIPFETEKRDESHPYIIAGGPASLNLEPIAPFLDAVCVGDGETRIVLMAETVREGKAANKTRSEILHDLSEIEGVYVPSLYTLEEKNGFTIPVGKTVKRYIESDLNRIDFNTSQIIPNTKSVQDRAVVEVARGCTRGCRFCQAGMMYRPVRERSISEIVSLAREAIQKTGYREFSLISLSISDYSRLNELIIALDNQFSEHGVSFSLPSLRLDSFSFELAEKVKQIRKSGLTFAVEGGTQCIRDAVNKGVKEDELFNVIDIATKLGWKKVKLYFMIGLPHQNTDENEVDGIIELVQRLTYRFKWIDITVSVALFVPKPHTPFQWSPLMSPETGREELGRLASHFRRFRKVNVRMNDPKVSYLEGIFARGDRKLAQTIVSAHQKGARFDGWSEHLNLDYWNEALDETGINRETYVTPDIGFDASLPWDIIDNGVTKKYLQIEYKKAMKGELTDDCVSRDGKATVKCGGCGSCDMAEVNNPNPSEGAIVPKNANTLDDTPDFDPDFLNNVKVKGNDVFYSIRFTFEKTGHFKYLNPIDMEELFTRAFIRANLPVKFSEGFNPHIRLEMSWAIPVGFESHYEACQVTLNEMVEAGAFITMMNRVLPEGIKIQKARCLTEHKKLNKYAHEQHVTFSFKKIEEKEIIMKRYESNLSFMKVTPKKEKIIQMDEYVKNIEFADDKVIVTYFQTDGGARIQDIIEALTGMDVRKSASELSPLILNRQSQRENNLIPIIDV